MTLKQKEIARQRAQVDAKMLTALLTWFIEQSGHPAYKDLTVPAECPKPNIVQDPDTTNNTDEEQDVEKETKFAGSTFHFAPGTHPTSKNSVYETNEKFVMAMIKCTMPTLHVHGGEYANLKELKLEDVCPVQFPFGLGGPGENRETPISPEETYKHYCQLSLRQFMRGDFLLVLKHMHNRMLSFKRACMSAKSSAFNSTLGKKLRKLA